jgi:hypothetical protein
MTRVLVKQGRGLVAVVALLALAVAACGSGGSPTIPGNNNTAGNGGTSQPGGTGADSFSSGLSANLDKLDSYKFTWTFSAGESGASASSALPASGTVINKPAKAAAVNYFGLMYVQIGTQQWMSLDEGKSYMLNTDSTSLDSMLPTKDYATYFDANAGNYKQVGATETKNGVACFHFQGDSSLGGVYAALAGGSASFHADLWVAKDGSYPVSGSFGFSFATGSDAGAWGYNFDITNINDPANKVEQPTNVTVLPS